MQFGAFLPSMRQWTSTVHTAVEETARAAEALGFASIWTNDVVIAPPDMPEMAGGILRSSSGFVWTKLASRHRSTIRFKPASST